MDYESRGDSGSPSIGSEANNPVSEGFAADLIGLPFEAAHVVYPAIEPLSDDEKAKIAGPFARILDKYNLGSKLSKDEIVLGFYLTAAIYARVNAVSAYRKRQKIEAEQVKRNMEADKGMPQ